MKFLFAILTFFQLQSGVFSDIPYDEIETAFSKKQAESIAKIGSEKLIVSIEGKENVYSRSQVSQVYKDFFQEHPLSSFKFIFKGKENADGTFGIATYNSKNQTYRFTFHFKKQDGSFKIIRLIIEKE